MARPASVQGVRGLVIANSFDAPPCPTCGAPTVRRVATRGPREGLALWGCSRYPACRGLINIDPDPPADGTVGAATIPAAYLQRRFERARERDRLRRRAMLPLFVALVILGMTIAFFALQPFGVVVASFGAVITGALGIYGLVRLPLESYMWAKGIEGERRAGDILGALEAAGFVTLYNRRVPGAKGDIDAITIGPTGVFAIETKNWSGRTAVHGERIWVGDHDRTWAVEQLYREAIAVQLAIGDELTAHRVTVTPVLFVVGGIARHTSHAVGGVAIADPKGLTAILRDRPAVFTDDEILALATVADVRLRPVMPWEAD